MTKRRALLLGLLALGALAAAAFALTRPAHETVPAVIDQPQDRATATLERAGFEVSPMTVENCAESGTVIEQQPAAGADAARGSTVTITVSLGLEVRVPPVRGQRLDRARSEIREQDLLVDTRERPSDTVGPGRIVRTNPAAGDVVDCGSVVTLVVSSGPELVELPTLVGLDRAAAAAQLRRLDLIPNTAREDADAPQGEVIGQDPGPGSTLEPGSVVTITVSTGAGSATVPGVEGRTLDAARQALSAAGLRANVIREETDVRRDDDRVLEQSPAAGQRARAGDTVNLVVGRFVEPPEPTEPDDEAPPEGASRRGESPGGDQP